MARAGSQPKRKSKQVTVLGDDLVCRFYTVFNPEMNTNFVLSIKFELKLNSDMKNLMLIIAIMFAAFQSNGQQIKPSNSGYAPVNGIKVYYEVYGEGSLSFYYMALFIQLR